MIYLAIFYKSKILYLDNPGIYLERKYNKALEIQNYYD